MNDLSALGIFFACLIGTLGLVRACEWLRPREQRKSEPASSGEPTEARP